MTLPQDLTDRLVYDPKKLRPNSHQQNASSSVIQRQRAISRDPLTITTYTLLALFFLAQIVFCLVFE